MKKKKTEIDDMMILNREILEIIIRWTHPENQHDRHNKTWKPTSKMVETFSARIYAMGTPAMLKRDLLLSISSIYGIIESLRDTSNPMWTTIPHPFTKG
jgi:hypothetical protein